MNKPGKNRPPKNRKPKPKRQPRQKHRGDQASDTISAVSVLIITGTNDDGELMAEPAKWDPKRKAPHIVVTESGRQTAAVKGDRVLAKMRPIKIQGSGRPHFYQALVIRVLPNEQPQHVLGVFVATAQNNIEGGGGFIEPISRKMKESFMVARGDTGDALNGELVSGITQPGIPSMGMTFAKITDRLGRLDSPRAASLIATHMHSLPSVFAEDVMEEAQAAEPPVMQKGRTDLRNIPLVTIDGADARDFDDAVFAEKDGTGWHIIVAIADVAYYVAEGSALDACAFERGNSVYFPDRVIPMLPERLSNGLCSLAPKEDRYCLAVHLWIDAEGNVKKYEFVRGLMKSRARLTYEEVELLSPSPLEGEGRGGGIFGKETPPLNPLPQGEGKLLITNLYGAYAALAIERDRRGALDLNLPEFKIIFDNSGNVASIAPKARLESHRLIEAYMIAANVAAADFLLKHKAPGIYRVHEPPAEEKLDDLKTLLQIAGYSLHVGAGIKGAHFNRILKQVEGKPEAYLVNTAILRSQMQAYYSHENLGHFGLSLQKYCHFTSPIRRYSDLVVHRSLVESCGLPQARAQDPVRSTASRHRILADIALHISDTERRAMMAERDASDRYKVSYMSRHIGANFMGVIVSLNEYGLFISLNDNGVTGFIPVRNLTGDFFRYDKPHACFKGQRTGQTFHIGQALMIGVQSANAITGSLIFELAGPVTAPDQPHKPVQHQHRPKKNKDRHRDRRNKGKRRVPTVRI
jgi:ribonuclease R